MPFAEVANLRAGCGAIEPPQAARDLLLPYSDRHQRLSLTQIDPGLDAMAGGLADHRQACAIGEQEIGILEVATLGEGEPQVPTQGPRGRTGGKRAGGTRSLAHDGLEINNTEPVALGGGACGLASSQPKCPEDTAGDHGANG